MLILWAKTLYPTHIPPLVDGVGTMTFVLELAVFDTAVLVTALLVLNTEDYCI